MKRLSQLLVLVLSLGFANPAWAQKDVPRKALLDLGQLQDSIGVRPKPVLLLVHTDWCVYCALQMQQLDLSSMGGKVYFAEFDAGHKHEVVFKGKRHRYRPSGKNTGIHGLVTEMAGEEPIAFPLWIVLSTDLEVLDTYTGYLRPKELKALVELLGATR